MRSIPLLVAGLITAGSVGLAAAPAEAAAPAPAPSVGYDVSYPQAPERPLPAAPAFTIVGINSGLATGTNPSLAAQLAWAGTATGTGHPAFEVYVNTANPGPKRAAWWPTGDRTRAGIRVRGPYGHCDGGPGRACAYVYGTSLAADDLRRGVPATAPARWWLDVEAANTWSGRTSRNRAVLEGMTARFRKAHARVGIYALPHEFRDLVGAVPAGSALAALPSWVAGAADESHARTLCTRAPLLRGRVQLVQWVGADAAGPIDHDLACALLTRAPKPRIAGGGATGTTLRATAGAWRPGGVHLAYRWTRDGAPIAGATHRTYRVTAKDAGHRVRVVVTGTKTGFSRAVRTSAPVRAHR